MKSYYMVTVKISKTSDHDPHNKKTGSCPVNLGKICTDITGEHHTILCKSESILDAKGYWESRGLHVTRVEEVLSNVAGPEEV